MFDVRLVVVHDRDVPPVSRIALRFFVRLGYHLLRQVEEQLLDASVQLGGRVVVPCPDGPRVPANKRRPSNSRFPVKVKLKRALLLFGCLRVDLSLALQVNLISGYGQGNVFAQHLTQLPHPVLHLDETVGIRDVVDLENRSRLFRVLPPKRKSDEKDLPAGLRSRLCSKLAPGRGTSLGRPCPIWPGSRVFRGC